MPVLYRDALPGDASKLTELAIESKRHWGYSDAMMELWRADLMFTISSIQDRTVVVAELENAIVGVAAITKDLADPELEDLWVHPRAIGQGIGRGLLKQAWNPILAAGAPRLVIVSDPNAAGFYRRIGAVQIGWHPSKPVGRFLPLFELTKEVARMDKPELSDTHGPPIM